MEGWVAAVVVAHPQEDFSKHFAPRRTELEVQENVYSERRGIYMFDEPQAARHRLLPLPLPRASTSTSAADLIHATEIALAENEE